MEFSFTFFLKTNLILFHNQIHLNNLTSCKYIKNVTLCVCVAFICQNDNAEQGAPKGGQILATEPLAADL